MRPADTEVCRVLVDPTNPFVAYKYQDVLIPCLVGRIEIHLVLHIPGETAAAGGLPMFEFRGQRVVIKKIFRRCIVEQRDLEGRPLCESPLTEIACLYRLNQLEPKLPNVIRLIDV